MQEGQASCFGRSVLQSSDADVEHESKAMCPLTYQMDSKYMNVFRKYVFHNPCRNQLFLMGIFMFFFTLLWIIPQNRA
jgi:hypothetical protein